MMDFWTRVFSCFWRSVSQEDEVVVAEFAVLIWSHLLELRVSVLVKFCVCVDRGGVSATDSDNDSGGKSDMSSQRPSK